MSKTSERIKWLDIIKGICILFVMLSHSYPPDDYQCFFTPFFISMFFFASGYTFSIKSGFKEFIIGKIYHLICPLFLLGTVRILGMKLLGDIDLFESFKGLLLQISCQKDEMWFVSCLFTASLLLYICIRINKRILYKMNQKVVLLCEAVLFGVMGYYIILFMQVRIIWEFEIACIMFIYMALGYLYKNSEVRYPQYTPFVLFFLYCAQLLLVKNDVDIHSEYFYNPIAFIVSSLLIIIPMIELAKYLERTIMVRPLVFLGQNSLFYFAFSGFVREIFRYVINIFGKLDSHIESLLCTLTMVVVLIIPAIMVNKYTPWLVGKYNFNFLPLKTKLKKLKSNCGRDIDVK